MTYITPWLLHIKEGGGFHVALGVFHGFEIPQAAAQCHLVWRKNLFLVRFPPPGHRKQPSHRTAGRLFD